MRYCFKYAKEKIYRDGKLISLSIVPFEVCKIKENNSDGWCKIGSTACEECENCVETGEEENNLFIVCKKIEEAANIKQEKKRRN